MLQKSQYVAVVVMIVGILSIASGVTFMVQGMVKADFMHKAMQLEEITLGIDESEVAKGNIVDSANEAQRAGDIIREHRRGIAETYGELLGGENFDPTDTTQLIWAQALNMENYLYLAVVGFGLTTVVIVSGAFMILTGIALGGTGVLLFRLSRKQSS